MASSQTPRRSNTIYSEGEKYRIQIYDASADPDYSGEIALLRDETDERWRFGVDDDSVAHFLTTTAVDDLAATPEIPAWVQELLAGVGIEGVET